MCWKNKISKMVERFRGGVEKHGFVKSVLLSIKFAITCLIYRLKITVFKFKYQQEISELRNLISHHVGFVDFFNIPMGWNTPLFQRFQHMSLQVAKYGGLAIYGGHFQVDKDVFVYKKISDNVYVINASNEFVVKSIFDELKKFKGKKIIRVQSIDLATRIEEINRFIADGFSIIYEYIDEICEDITGKVPAFVQQRHEFLLRNERVAVVATSDKLYMEVKRFREHNLLLSSNGVDVEHWRLLPDQPPEDLLPLLNSGRHLVGYHGALARWIDYDLLKKIAAQRDFELVLIGFEHDKSFSESGLNSCENVHFLGSKSYFCLNSYAFFYDVAILPFQQNVLTESVSPVKIFEYMAAGKPVVATDIPECRKYRSCLIADSHSEFINKLYQAIELKSSREFQALVSREASMNSWDSKAKEVFSMVGVML